ncbi:uncharacterized protein B0I36DRAFT_389643, partial [Microdochium trichocladiopsis]
MPRLGAIKSRNGCEKCKQRRVKCDEKVPCSACTRHGIRCTLLDRPVVERRDRPRDAEHAGSIVNDRSARRESARLFQLRSVMPAQDSVLQLESDDSSRELQSQQQYGLSQSANLSDQQQIGYGGPSATRDPFPYFTPLMNDDQTAPLQTPQQWTTDLELMHHYSAVTWQSLPRAADHPEIWQVEVPKLAFKHEFLMHQLLAISAFHMLHLDPGSSTSRRRHYQLLAIQHQNKAIAGLRSAIPQLDSSTCDVMFVAASLSLINGFATFSQQPRRLEQEQQHMSPESTGTGGSSEPPDLDNLLDVFRLLRGLKSILSAYESDVEKSSIGCLLRIEQHYSVNPLLTSIIVDVSASDLLHLRGGNNGATSYSAEAICCQEAAACLIEWIGRAISDATAPELRLVSTWPIAISEEFMTLMGSRDQRAMRLLEHYCRILGQAGVNYWYLSGWAKSVQSNISSDGSSSSSSSSSSTPKLS